LHAVITLSLGELTMIEVLSTRTSCPCNSPRIAAIYVPNWPAYCACNSLRSKCIATREPASFRSAAPIAFRQGHAIIILNVGGARLHGTLFE